MFFFCWQSVLLFTLFIYMRRSDKIVLNALQCNNRPPHEYFLSVINFLSPFFGGGVLFID